MAFSFLAEMAFCWKLWIPVGREFPKVPAFDFIAPNFSLYSNTFILGLLILGLIGVILNQFPRYSIWLTLFCFFLLILEDITRLQPWVYSQGIILFLFSLKKEQRNKGILYGTLLVIAGVYIWSGIQKINVGFLNGTFPWMLSALGIDIEIDPEQPMRWFNYAFLIAPVIEILCGVFLLRNRTRKTGAVLGIGIHLFNLLVLGPFGHNWNSVTWPWNVSLILFLLIWFRSDLSLNFKSAVSQVKWNFLALFLFFVMPFFNFFGIWDDNLSGCMYSGTHSDVAFYFDSPSESKMQFYQELASSDYVHPDGHYQLTKSWMTYWSMYDLNAPIYPAPRYYGRIAMEMCKEVNNPAKAGLEVVTRAKFSAQQTTTICNCMDLLHAAEN